MSPTEINCEDATRMNWIEIGHNG